MDLVGRDSLLGIVKLKKWPTEVRGGCFCDFQIVGPIVFRAKQHGMAEPFYWTILYHHLANIDSCPEIMCINYQTRLEYWAPAYRTVHGHILFTHCGDVHVTNADSSVAKRVIEKIILNSSRN